MQKAFDVQKYWDEVNSRRHTTEWLRQFYSELTAGPPYPTREHESRARERDWMTAQIDRFGWKTLLDSGCGPGFWFQLWKEKSVDATGVDRAATAIPKAQDMASTISAPFSVHHHPLDSLPFRDKQFDVAVTVKVLIHTPPDTIRNAIAELSRVSSHLMFLEARYVGKTPAQHVFDHDFEGIVTSIGGEVLVKDDFEQQQHFYVVKTR